MVGIHLTPEQRALLAVSRTSWRRRGVAKSRQLFFGEESVTETVLMDLAESFPGQLSILPFNKVEEGKAGADWAWAISNAAATATLPMLVQAKALDFSDQSYAELKRTIGKQKPPVRQIDRLLETAELLNWPAIYAFYNNVTDLSRLPHTCGTLPDLQEPNLHEAWGISFADAFRVREALDPSDDQTFDSHCRLSQPLLCLLCQFGSGPRKPRDSPHAAFQALSRLRSRPALGAAREVEFVREGPMPRIEPHLPAVFARAEEIVREDRVERRVARARELSEEYPTLAGVMITRDTPHD